MPLQPAVLGTARLNNFRLNYLTPALALERPAKIWIILGGVDISAPTSPIRVLYNSISIRDLVFESPNTCNLTFYGAAPVLGSRLEIWVDSAEPKLLFGGELQTVDRTYKGRPSTVIHPCTAIDDTARANRKRPLGLFTNVSATTIAQTLMSTYAPGYSSAGVELGLPAVTVNFDGSEGGMKGCLTQLAKLIGGYWYFEQKTLYLFVTPPGPAPDPINDTPGRFLHDPQIRYSVDKSQVRTRVFGKGASSQLAATVDPTITIVPLDEVTMFNPVGGKAIGAVTPDGAASRVLTYTGVQVGGGGGLIGPGAAPSSAPGLTLVTGAGVDSGVHQYAQTFVTAAGESLPGPVASIAVGPLAVPPAAIVTAPTTGGPGPSPGAHNYGVTYVTASGETTGSAPATGVTGVTAAPPTGATPGAVTAGGSIEPGTYRYGVTFVTAIGETTGGPESAPVETLADVGGHYVTPPMDAIIGLSPVLDVMTTAYAPGDSLTYRYAFVNAAGVTTAGPLTAAVTAIHYPGQPANVSQGIYLSSIAVSSDPSVTSRRIYRYKNNVYQGHYDITKTGTNYLADGNVATTPGVPPGANTAFVPGAPYKTVSLSNIPKGDSSVTARKLYRFNGAGAYRLVDTIANNTATTYTDTKAEASLGAAAPGVNTAYLQQIRLTVPLGPSLVTQRKIYRQPGGVGPYTLAATLADNTTTAWIDTVPDASLGVAAPATNTALANQVLITIALGGAGVTARKVYRSLANQTPLKWLATHPDNTTTVIGPDTFSDAAIAGNAAPPVADTSGLQQPSGQVLPGATTIIVANANAFISAGGWAVIGNGEQVIRYTAKTANTLTGVPASGLGAVVAAVSYNSTITAAPALTGVAGILETMLDGSPVHVWVQRDDTAAQAYMLALDGTGDGIYEHIISDERRNEASLVQACDAELELYSRPLVTVVYASRDTKTKSGKTVQIALASPAMAESLVIQDVAISEIGIAPILKPKFTVTASSVRHSFEAILQMLIKKAGA